MVLYIAFIASFNLCVGYVLGVYIGVMPGLKRRATEDTPDEEPIELAQAVVAPKKAKPAPKPAAKLAEPEPAQAEAAPEPEPPEESPAEVAQEESAEEEPAVEAAEATEPEPEPEPVPEIEAEAEPEAEPVRKAQTSDILAGLASFREKLSAVGDELRKADDEEAVEQCAGDLKKANDDYLEQAHEAIDSIDQADEAANAEDEQLKATLVEQADQVEKANNRIDEAMQADDPTKIKEQLIASTDELVESTEKAESSLPGAAEEAEDSPGELGLVELDKLMVAIDQELEEDGEQGRLQVAAICFDLPDGGESKLENADRLLSGLGQIVEELLGPGQAAAIDEENRLLLLLSGDDESAATEKCELARQKVSAARFVCDEQEVAATVSCAVVDNSGTSDRNVLLQRLGESMEEASRYGSNRTFHHDGKFPAPVVPHTMEVESQTITI